MEEAHLLVVESVLETRDALVGYLGGNGRKITFLDAADDALSEIEKQSVDLILLAVPGADGNSRRAMGVLKQGGVLGSIPVVVLSRSEGQAVDTYLEMGADDFLFEPVSPGLLKARVDACLERKQLRKVSHDLRSVVLPLGTALSLSTEHDCDQVIERILLEAKKLCNADGGTLYLRTEDDRLVFTILHNDSMHLRLGGSTGGKILLPPLNLYDPETRKPNHHNVATHVVHEGHSVNIPDIYHAEGFDFSGAKRFDQSHGYRSISSLTVPLLDHEGRAMGVLQLLNARHPGANRVIPFSLYLQEVVECLASQAAVALSNHLLLERQKELLKGERDLQIGRKIQKDFLPSSLPDPEGWDVGARFEPARTVSGDFYDAFMLQDSRMGFIIADVCDKGVGAALFMALIRSLMRAFAQKPVLFSDPAATFECGVPHCPLTEAHRVKAAALNSSVVFTNNYILENHSHLNMFATLFFGVVDLATGEMHYVNCGHEPPIILNANRVKARLKPTGPAVGTFPDLEYPFKSFQFEPGDTFVGFTDGVLDARNANGDSFHIEGLLELLEQPADSASELVTRIERRVRAHIGGANQFDDITLFAVRRSAPERA